MIETRVKIKNVPIISLKAILINLNKADTIFLKELFKKSSSLLRILKRGAITKIRKVVDKRNAI